MPPRSAIDLLPAGIKEELNRRLVANSFSDYVALSDWLKSQGFEISKSSIHRYGQDFEDKLAALKIATEQARAIAESAPDDEGLMGDALLRLAQQKAFDVLMQMEMDAEQIEKIDFARLLKGVSDLGKAGVLQKKWMAEMRSKCEKAADEATEALQKAGVSDETAAMIRLKFLGLAG